METGNLQAAPSTCKLGHGWMGHLPDFSFISYFYKPFWNSNDGIIERDNKKEYMFAFIELCSLFARSKGKYFIPDDHKKALDAAKEAIGTSCKLAEKKLGRVVSAKAWINVMDKLGYGTPKCVIDVEKEPDTKAVLKGEIDYNSMMGTRYGTYYINLKSDLYLFEIAADYHFHFVKYYLNSHNVGKGLFDDSWCRQLGPLSKNIENIFNPSSDIAPYNNDDIEDIVSPSITGVERYTIGDFKDYACHVFALSGVIGEAREINDRYDLLGNLLLNERKNIVDKDSVPKGLKNVTYAQISDCRNNQISLQQEILSLLCTEFDFVEQKDSKIRLWGYFGKTTSLSPDHMYVEYGDIFYDTMPGSHTLRTRSNQNKNNPPSEASLLNINKIFSIGVKTLASGTQAVINTSNELWIRVK